MGRANQSLTAAEWSLMEALWEKPGSTGRELIQQLFDTNGWNRSTTLTMLRRMTEKGIITCREEDGLRHYSPAVDRNDALLEQTHSFLERAYRGSVSLLVSAMTQRQALSQDEIDELYEILKKAKEDGSHD